MTRAQSLRQLRAALDEAKPERLIFLGDSFHDGEARERIDAADLATLRAITSAVETVWITGNHDPAPPEDIGGRIVEEMALGPVTLRHQATDAARRTRPKSPATFTRLRPCMRAGTASAAAASSPTSAA